MSYASTKTHDEDKRADMVRLRPCRQCAHGSLLPDRWDLGVYRCHLCGRSNRPKTQARPGQLREPFLPEKGFVQRRPRSVAA